MTAAGNDWSAEEFEALRKVFYAQAYEVVDELQDAVLRLEADPADEETIKSVKRQVHTLKGDSNSIGLPSIGTLCHRMEDVICLIEDSTPGTEQEAVDLLMSGIDTIHALLARSECGETIDGAGEMIDKLARFVVGRAKGPGEAGSPTPEAAGADRLKLTEYQELQVREAVGSGLRVYDIEIGFHPQCAETGVAALMVTARLGGRGRILRAVPDPGSGELQGATAFTVLFGTELDAEAVRAEALIPGMVSEVSVNERAAAAPRAPQEPSAQPAARSRSEMLRVETSRVDEIMDLVGELIISRSMLDQVALEMEAGTSPADSAARISALNASMERTVSDLQKGVMKMRMVSLYQVFRKFPKMVRDLCAKNGRRVRLELSGQETELDKRIVDALGEPLAHIIRNMIDHGIETPEERRRAGKHEEGTITLTAYHEASQIVVEARDDGRGIDSDTLRSKAVEKGFLGRAEADALSDADAVDLVFLPGLSTAAEVSETSGRGVGMDAVKTSVEGMKGSIEIATKPGKGTLFRLRLPLTLAVIKALLFTVGGRIYAVPVSVIVEVAGVTADDLVTVEGRKTLLLRDQIISVIALEELFHLPGNGQREKHVLILGVGGKKVGLVIDRLLRQQELVIKAIDDSHIRSDFVAGASILGSGQVVLILDAATVYKKAVEEEKRKRYAAA